MFGAWRRGFPVRIQCLGNLESVSQKILSDWNGVISLLSFHYVFFTFEYMQNIRSCGISQYSMYVSLNEETEKKKE